MAQWVITTVVVLTAAAAWATATKADGATKDSKTMHRQCQNSATELSQAKLLGMESKAGKQKAARKLKEKEKGNQKETQKLCRRGEYYPENDSEISSVLGEAT
mgnify:CR=1 FL=1